MRKPTFGPAAIAVGGLVLGGGCSGLSGPAGDIVRLPARLAGDHGLTCPEAPSDIDPENRVALDVTNAARSVIGLPCLTYHAAIDMAATAHCRYYARNADAAVSACIARPHVEVPGCEGFVAERFGDRLRKAGYDGVPAYEVIAYENDGHNAVGRWLDSVWHRIPFVSSLVTDASYGHANGCDTMDFGRNHIRLPSRTVVYPVPDQIGVPTSFDGLESPEPPPPPQGWPSGYPVMVHTADLKVHTHELLKEETGEALDHIWIDPDSPDAAGRLAFEHVLYAERPLEKRTRYRVHLVGETGFGRRAVLDWSFTTR